MCRYFRTDILAYKTLTINETDGTPEVSNWLRGSVQHVDVKNKRSDPNPRIENFPLGNCG